MREILQMAVAIEQHHGFKSINRTQRCSLQSFTKIVDHNNILEVSDTESLKQAFEGDNIHRSFSTPCFPIASSVKEDVKINPKIEIVGGRGAPKVRAFVVEVAIAMASEFNLLPLLSGLGGAYLLRSKNGDDVAIVKPVDEEPLAFNNPKGFGGLMLGQPGIKRSICVGETGIRELAAYLLDHENFAGVPATSLVKIAHVGFCFCDAKDTSPVSSKVASIQRFVHHEFDAGELGPSSFSVASVHRIGIFDIRVLNLDRHAGNILVKKFDMSGHYTVGEAELVPIDHGLCLPEWFDDPYFEWLHWPQASIPFSETEIFYISKLDPFKDAQLLRKEIPNLKESSIRVMIICTIFLKSAVSAGFCLTDIGEMMTREFDGGEENLSVLENLCAKAKAKASVIDIFKENEDTNNDQNKEEAIISEIFYFDDESDDISSDITNLPHLLECSLNKIGKPPKAPRFTSAKSMPRLDDETFIPLSKENDSKRIILYHSSENNNILCCHDPNAGFMRDHNKALGMTKSISYSIQGYDNETTEVSIGDLSIDEWDMFLECFQQLLPEVLYEGTKCKGLKQRLGNSCMF